MKTADLPGARLETPLSGTASPAESELSSIFQPVRSAVFVPVLVSSHQSALWGLLPLLQGEASVTATPDAGLPPPETGSTVSVNGELVASGLPPAAGSSTATLTV